MQKLLAMFLVLLQFLPYATWGCGQENAYLTVIKELAQNRERELKYIIVDWSDVKLANTAKLEKAFETYCCKHGITVLPHDFERLDAEGYIRYEETFYFDDGEEYTHWTFTDGIFIGFNDEKLTGNTLKTDVGTHCSKLNPLYIGDNYEFKVKRVGFMWFIVGKEGGVVA